MNGLQLLAELAPWLAIVGFLLIAIKFFVGDGIKKMMCMHIMILSAAAFICYMIRYSFLDGNKDWLTLGTGLCWVVIGSLNYIEWKIIHKRQ